MVRGRSQCYYTLAQTNATLVLKSQIKFLPTVLRILSTQVGTALLDAQHLLLCDF